MTRELVKGSRSPMRSETTVAVRVGASSTWHDVTGPLAARVKALAARPARARR